MIRYMDHIFNCLLACFDFLKLIFVFLTLPAWIIPYVIYKYYIKGL